MAREWREGHINCAALYVFIHERLSSRIKLRKTIEKNRRNDNMHIIISVVVCSFTISGWFVNFIHFVFVLVVVIVDVYRRSSRVSHEFASGTRVVRIGFAIAGRRS